VKKQATTAANLKGYLGPTVLISSALLLTGCSQAQRTVEERAPFDLECPKEQVQIHKLGEWTYGATGCDKRITYSVRGHCDGLGWCKAEKETNEIVIKKEQ
jgi:hypothetical protein